MIIIIVQVVNLYPTRLLIRIHTFYKVSSWNSKECFVLDTLHAYNPNIITESVNEPGNFPIQSPKTES